MIMNKKYIKYIDYIVSDIEKPYLKYLNMYGLRHDEYELVLSKLYDQPITIKDNRVNDTNGNKIYYESINGDWYKKEYDTNGNEIYFEYSNGFWVKYEYNTNGNKIYYEDSNGDIIDNL
jgi:hypothetical protein